MAKSIIAAIDEVSGAATASKSIAEAIEGLDGLVVSDGAAAVAAELEPDGDITAAIAAAVAAELAPTGDITTAIGTGAAAVLAAALEPTGDITTAIEAADKTAAYQADSTAAEVGDLVTDFNALIAKLQAAGLMAGAEG